MLVLPRDFLKYSAIKGLHKSFNRQGKDGCDFIKFFLKIFLIALDEWENVLYNNIGITDRGAVSASTEDTEGKYGSEESNH